MQQLYFLLWQPNQSHVTWNLHKMHFFVCFPFTGCVVCVWRADLSKYCTIYLHVNSSWWIDANLCRRLLELFLYPDFVIFHSFAMLHGLLVLLLQTVDLLMMNNLLVFKIVNLEAICDLLLQKEMAKMANLPSLLQLVP